MDTGTDFCRARRRSKTYNVEHNVVGPCMQHWLITRTPTELARVLSHENPFDARNHKQTQPNVELDDEGEVCDTCQRMFRTIHALSVHKVKAHGERNKYRAQVVSTNCPGCDKSFSNIHNAQSHWAKQICVRNQTARRSFADIEAQSHVPSQPKADSPRQEGDNHVLSALGAARDNVATGAPIAPQNESVTSSITVSGQAGNTVLPQGTSGDAVALEGTAGC